MAYIMPPLHQRIGKIKSDLFASLGFVQLDVIGLEFGEGVGVEEFPCFLSGVVVALFDYCWTMIK